MKPFYSGIRRQLLLMLLIVMIPAAGHLWYAGHVQRQQALEFATLQVDKSVEIFHAHQQLLVEQTQHLLSVLSHLPAIENLTAPACSTAMATLHASYPKYSTMVVASPQGIINCCSLPLEGPLNVADREWFRRVLQTRQFVVGNFIISRTSGKASLPFAYPVLNQDGTIRHILGAALDLQVYDGLLKDFSLPEGAQVLIADRDGAILYASESSPGQVGGSIESVLGLTLPATGETGNISTRQEHKGHLYWFRSLTVGKENNAIFLITTMPATTLFAGINALQTSHTLLLFALLLLLAGFAWYAGGRLIITPIQFLVDQTRRISSGRMGEMASPPRLSGEFQILAEAFATMTRQLAEREKERDTSEQALHESEQRYRALFEQSPISLWEEDLSILKSHLSALAAAGINDFDAYFDENPDRILPCLKMIKILHVNRATLELYEAAAEDELVGSLDKIIPPASLHLMQAELVAIAEGKPFAIEVENVTLNNRVFPALINSALPSGYEESWARVFVSVFDLTERYRVEQQHKELERQLMLAQKMETVGTLAGGIAHDFNNILSPIIGYTELSLASSDLRPETRSHLTNILTAAQRAKEMVHQILAFSRRQESRREPIHLTAIAREALDLLRSSIPTTIELRAELAAGLAPVSGDASRIHQVIMNLCTNAYQALKTTGGVITIHVEGGTPQRDAHPVRSGPHLVLSVTDDGPGIPYELQEKIFDPFFTTKAPGDGSGMGLAVVHGIIKDHGGTIEVQSEPGHGTTFQVYLPCGEESTVMEPYESDEPYPTGNEHVLVIDDEESLVHMTGTILQKLGYTVSGYTSSMEALQAFRARPDSFDLLITDQTMPMLTGMETAREMLAIRYDLPVILYTGFSETTSPEKAKEAGIRRFLYKPLSTAQLAGAVREVLDEQHGID